MGRTGLTAAGKQAVRDRMQAIFEAKRAAKKKGFVNVKQRRLANKYHLLAMDHAIQNGLGMLGFLAFRAPRPLLPLGATERRYFVPMDSLPADLQQLAAGRTRRACIADSAPGTQRLEVCWSEPRPSLHCVLDMGTIGWPSKFGLFHASKGQLRGWWEVDPPHRRHNNAKNALSQSGLTWAKLEVLLSTTVASGPFDGAAFFGVIQGAATELFQEFDHTCALFVHWYPRLSFQLHEGRVPLTYGTDEHMVEVWRMASEAWVLHRKGMKAKLGRWFQVFQRPREQEPCWAVMAMVLTYIGFVEGWFADGLENASHDEAPASGAQAASSQQPGPGHPAAPQPQGGHVAPEGQAVQQTVAQSNQEVEQLRKGTKNLMHLTLNIFSKDVLRSLWMLCDRVTSPIMEEHSATLVAHKTQAGCMQWSIQAATADYEVYLLRSLHALCSRDVMVSVGLLPHTPACQQFMLNEADAQKVIQAAWEYALALTGMELTWMKRYRDSPPGRFAALLDPGSRGLALKDLKLWWACLCEYEADMAEDRGLEEFHSNLLWPQATWVREVAIGLAEADFEQVPSDIALEIQQACMAFKTTKVAEDAFNLLRDKGRHHKAKKQGALKRYHHLATSPLLADCDRPPCTAPVVGKPSQIPQEYFEARCNQEFSLGEQYLQKTLEERGAEMGANRYLQTPLAWQALVSFRGAWAKLHSLWYSMMAPPGIFVHKKGSKGSVRGLVLSSSPFGCLALNLHFRKHGEHNVASFPAATPAQPAAAGEEAGPFLQLLITDPREWMVIPLELKTPSWAASNLGSPDKAGAMEGITMVTAKGKQKNLLLHSAEQGFKTLTVAQMNKLIDEEAIQYEGRRPALEGEVATLCVQHFLPNLSKEQVAAIVALRSLRKKKEPFPTELTEENINIAAEAMDADDDLTEPLQQQVKAQKAMALVRVKAVKPAAVAGLGVAQALAGRAAASSSSSSSAAPRVWPVLEQRSYLLEEARLFLPQRTGCVLSIHSNSAWLVKYPRDSPPRSHSRSFAPGDAKSNFESLKACILWAWDCHKEATGQSCPFELQ